MKVRIEILEMIYLRPGILVESLCQIESFHVEGKA
jgi:hypothetical protein